MSRYIPRVAVVSMALALTLSLAACNSKTARSPEQSAATTPGAAPATVPQPEPVAPPTQTQPAVPAPPPEPAAPPPPPVPRILPAGTSFSTRIGSEISSKASHAGDTFSGSLASPVRLKGNTVIPAGSAVSGVVVGAHSAGKFKGAATLSLKLVSVTVRGKSYPIQTVAISQETKGKGKRTGAMVGGGAAGGALIGGLAGGGKGALIGGAVGAGAGTAGAAFSGNNRDIDYPAETVLPFRLSSSLNLGAGPAAAQAEAAAVPAGATP